MSGQIVGYVRVSTTDQNTDRQLDGVQLDEVFTDKASGGTTDRPQLHLCLRHLRKGDTLVVHSMDRLARNLDDLRKIVLGLTERGATVRFHKEGLTFSADKKDAMGELLLNVMGAFAQFERSLIRERQAEGIAKAKEKGVYKGRKKALTPDQVAALIEEAKSGESKTAIAKRHGISRETLYQYLRAAA